MPNDDIAHVRERLKKVRLPPVFERVAAKPASKIGRIKPRTISTVGTRG